MTKSKLMPAWHVGFPITFSKLEDFLLIFFANVDRNINEKKIIHFFAPSLSLVSDQYVHNLDIHIFSAYTSCYR